ELRRARGGPAPAQEQIEAENEPDDADHHQDDPDGVDVDALDVRRHGVLEDRAHSDQEQGGADSHATVGRPRAARGNQVGGAASGPSRSWTASKSRSSAPSPRASPAPAAGSR